MRSASDLSALLQDGACGGLSPEEDGLCDMVEESGGRKASDASVLPLSEEGTLFSPWEFEAVQWVRDDFHSSNRKTLHLVTESWDDRTRKCAPVCDAHHVLTLWRMSNEKRLSLWGSIMEGNCQCLPLEVLSLSGDYETKCTVCNEEIAFLCAKGLPELRCLSLQWAPMLGDPSMELLAGAGGAHRLTSLSLGVLNSLSDRGLAALASAGCGPQLTHLSLKRLQRVSDDGFHALASAGCGCQLTSLSLSWLERVTDHGL